MKMWMKYWRMTALMAATVLLGFAAKFWVRENNRVEASRNDLHVSDQGAPREYVFQDPISSRRALLTTDPVLQYLMDRVGGTQVDVIYVDPKKWILDLEKATSQNRVSHAWPKGIFILSQSEYESMKRIAPDWPFDQVLLFEQALSGTLLTSFSFNFLAAQRWSDEFAQWMIGQDPLHQELFVLNADLLRVELLSLQSRWAKLLRSIQKVEGVTEEEAQVLGFPGVGKAKQEGQLILQFVEAKDEESRDSVCEVHLKSPRSEKNEIPPLEFSKDALLGKSWLKVWDINLSQLEAAVRRLENLD